MDAVLAFPISLQPFEAIAWQRRKIPDCSRSIDPIELLPGNALKSGKGLDSLTGREVAGSLVPVT
jgi:hypothetical protein